MGSAVKKVLVVDDDLICLTFVKTMLEEDFQCEVDVAMSATDALHKIYEKGFEWQPVWYDLILMDINLPVLNGDIVTKIIKETEERIEHIPVIAITIDKTALNRKAEFLKLGITDIVIKPITNDKVEEIMQKYVDGDNH